MSNLHNNFSTAGRLNMESDPIVSTEPKTPEAAAVWTGKSCVHCGCEWRKGAIGICNDCERPAEGSK